MNRPAILAELESRIERTKCRKIAKGVSALNDRSGKRNIFMTCRVWMVHELLPRKRKDSSQIRASSGAFSRVIIRLFFRTLGLSHIEDRS